MHGEFQDCVCSQSMNLSIEWYCIYAFIQHLSQCTSIRGAPSARNPRKSSKGVL